MMKQCKIIINDEVNVSIKGLELDHRKQLVKKFKIVDPTARFRPAYKLGRWDGSVSFFGLGGNTYLNLLEDILIYIDSHNYDIEIEDHRKSQELIFDQVTENFWGEKVWPPGHPKAGELILLRDYQVEIINTFLKNPQSLQSISTGAGKTIVTATLAKLCEKYGRTITIVPNKSLVEQTEEDFINVGLDVGVYYGDRKDLGKTHTISTWQSLNVLDKKSKNNLEEEIFTLEDFLHNVNAVIVDEAHGVAGDVLKTLLTKNLANTPIRWGLTGTIPKDEISLMNLKVSLGNVVHEVKASDLQEQGVLSNCFINIIQTDEYKEFGKYQEELKFLVTDQERINYIGKLCSNIAEKGNTLILVDRLETGNMLLNLIKDSVFISGEVKTKERKTHYNEINFSENKVIIATFGVAAVGINIVRINNLVLLEPGKSFIRVIQSIGRGLRKGFDKDFVNIYDVTASTKYAKKHLAERKKYYKTANYAFKIERVNFR